VEDHSSRLEQVEDRISELKDKIEIKEKNWRNLSQTTEELWKEYARTHWLHQKTKPENHRRRGPSIRES
jgi:outer membrane phospholipase A